MAASVECIMQDVAAWLKGVAGALAPQAYIVAPGDAAGGVEVGDLEELTLDSGEVKPVKVIAVDTISYPPRVKVNMVDSQGQTTDKILVVPVIQQKDAERINHGTKVMVDAIQTTVYQDYEDAFTLHNDVGDGDKAIHSADESQPADECDHGDEHPIITKRTSGTKVGQAILQGVSQEIQLTVQDVREKGAVGALRDAALDVIDCVGDAAGIAADKARALMAERKEIIWTENHPATLIERRLPSGITLALGPQSEQQN